MTENTIQINIHGTDDASAVLLGVNKALGKMRGSTDQLRKSGDRLAKTQERVVKTQKQMGSALKGLRIGLVSVVASLGIAQIAKYADGWTTVNNRIKLVTKSNKQLITAQRELFNLAQESRGALKTTAELYQRLSFSAEKLKLSQQDLFDITSTINKTLVISGSSTQSANAALIQLGQGIAAGTLRGQELNAVLEQAPRLAKAIADGLGTEVGQLKKLGEQGRITAEAIITALTNQGSVVSKEFSKTTQTIAQSFVTINNSLTRLVGRFSEVSGASAEVQRGLGFLRSTIDELSKAENIAILSAAFNDLINSIAPLFGGASGVNVTKGIVEFGATFLRVTGRVIDGIVLIREGFNLFRDGLFTLFRDIGTIDLTELFTRFIKGYAKVFFNIVKMFGNLGQGIDRITRATLKLLIAPFQSTFQFIFEWVATAFKKFVTNPITSTWRKSLLLIADGVGHLNDEAAASIRGYVSSLEELEDIELPEFDAAGNKAQTIADIQAAYQGLKDVVGEVGSTLWDDLNVVGGETFNLFADMADIIDPSGELGLRFDMLREKGGELFDPIIIDGADAQVALGGVGDEAEAMEGRVQGVLSRLSAAFLEGIRNGVEQYRASLGTLAENTASAVNDALSTLEDGVSKGINALLFGPQSEKEVKEAIGGLKDFRDEFSDVLDFGSDALSLLSLEGFKADLDEIANGDLPDKVSSRITELGNDILKIGTGTQTQDGILGQTDGLIKQLESQSGLMGRLRAFGGSIKDALSQGFKESVTSILTKEAMKGLLSFTDDGLGLIAAAGKSIIGKIGLGAKDEIASNEDLKAAGGQIAGVIDDGFGNVVSFSSALGGELTKMTTGIDGFDFLNRGKISDGITDGAEDVWGMSAKLGKTTTGMVGSIGSFSFLTKGQIANPLTHGMDSVWSMPQAMGNALGGAANQVGSFGFITKGKIAEPLKDGMGDVWGMGQSIGGALGDAAGHVGSFSFLTKGMIANPLTHGMADVWGMPKSVGATLGDVAGHVGSFGFISKGKVAGALTDGWDAVRDFPKDLGAALTDTATKIGSFIVNNGGKIAGAINAGLDNLGFVGDFGKGFIDGNLALFTEIGTGLGGILKRGFEAVTGVDAFGAIGNSLKSALGLGSFGSEGGLAYDIGYSMGQALGAGLIAYNVAGLFGPEGQIGAAIGAALGTLFLGVLGPYGGLLGGVAGNLLDRVFNAGKVERKEKEQAGAQELNAVLRQFGGANALLEAGGGQGSGIGRLIEEGGFERAAFVLSNSTEGGDAVREALTLAFIAEGQARARAEDIVQSLFVRLRRGPGKGNANGPDEHAIPEGFDPNSPDPFATGGDGAAKPVATPSVPPAPANGPPTPPRIPSVPSSIAALTGYHIDPVPGWARPIVLADLKDGRAYLPGGMLQAGADIFSNAGMRIGGIIAAKDGLRRVPGADGQAVPAMLHGGEMVVPARRVRQMEEGGGGSAAIHLTMQNTFHFNGGGGDMNALSQAAEKMLGPAFERRVMEAIEKTGRYGRLEIASRSIRNVAS